MNAQSQFPRIVIWLWIHGALATSGLLAGDRLVDWIWPLVQPPSSLLATNLPQAERTLGYVGSAQCSACHAEEHSAWHRSYHRTMTQPAMAETVLGRFEGQTIEVGGLDYRVFREEGVYWAEMPDPDLMMQAESSKKPVDRRKIPRVRRPVVMTTGSHHYQTYWVASQRVPGLLQTLPLVYLISDQRWMPRDEAFLRGPEDRQRLIIQWNHQCIRCHSTAGNPGLDESSGLLKTKVGELGISCEACHGPGEKHVNERRTLQTDPAQNGPPAYDLINPSKLDHRRSSEVCGQCHGAYILRPEQSMRFATNGSAYRPGDRLFQTRYEVKHPRVDPRPERVADYRRNPEFFREQWWDDGTILAGGREFNGLAASKCFTRGTLGCTTCHTMHGTDPDDQLKPTGATPQSCITCHTEPRFTDQISEHTHHLKESEGSNCLNCHMPHTTYALFKAIRSHQIESPSNERLSRYGTPNACNLCHLDKTLAWTRDNLFVQYGQKRYPLTAEQERTSAGALWMLQGNAAQRVIAAWHSGWKPALQTSGTNWMTPIQAQLLSDDYAVIRRVVSGALSKSPDFDAAAYDFMAPTERLRGSTQQVLQKWLESGRPRQRTGSAVLIGPDGTWNNAELESLLGKRDQRSITIQE